MTTPPPGTPPTPDGSQSPADGSAVPPDRIGWEVMPAPVRLWLSPVRQALDVVAATIDKPAGQLTMIELVAWGSVVAYAVMSGVIAGQLAANLAVVALRGPGRR